VTLTPVIHHGIAPAHGARVVDLPYVHGESLLHYNYLDTAHFLGKLDAYTTVEAAQAHGRGEGSTPFGALRDAAREWTARYLWHRGYRDGWRGFYLALFMAGYRLAVHAKLTERAVLGPRSEIERRYREDAERVLAGYSDEPSPAR
jgi:hypothetical protein